jgi:hypothetical protein
MKITRSALKRLIKEEMNRSRTLNENVRARDAALVYARMSPKADTALGALRKAWELGEYDVILRAGAQKDITPDSAFEYFTTPGEGLYFGPSLFGVGGKPSVEIMFQSTLRDDGMLAALDFALKSGASFDIPGWDRMNPDLPFGKVDQFVMAKASGR